MLLFRNKNKKVISEFLKTAYSDQKLDYMLRFARRGGLTWNHSCLVILADKLDMPISAVTSAPARAFLRLGFGFLNYLGCADDDETRNRKMVPLLEAEIKRREKIKQQEETTRLAEGKALTEELTKSMTGKESYETSKHDITESVR